MTDRPLIHIDNVSKVYQQGATPVHALRNVGLEIHAGEFTALAGPSGSGKTTLLNLIGALDSADSGNVVLGEQSLGKLSRTELAQLRLRKIGFVFQDYSLIPVLSALENVEYVMVLQGIPHNERRSRAEELLTLLGLGACLHRRPAQLSGGQQQRVAIARALAGQPMLVLADEPTANLDSDTAAALLDTMLELNRSRGVTFVFSTHDAMVMKYARRVIKMKDGAIVEDASDAVH